MTNLVLGGKKQRDSAKPFLEDHAGAGLGALFTDIETPVKSWSGVGAVQAVPGRSKGCLELTYLVTY
jgi:hypothetical protein